MCLYTTWIKVKRIISNEWNFYFFDLLRCSVDELLTHPFFKHSKKITNDPNLLADDMAKLLGSYKEKELNQRETNNVEIFGKIN